MKNNMNHCIEFGDFIRSKRVANRITAREASQMAGMLPSNFSKLEHGALAPPREPNKLSAVAQAIGVKGTADEATFFDLAAKANNSVPADIADIITRNDALPLLLRTIGNKRLSKEQIDRLVEIVRGRK
ncbi:MAG: helix-turn-helix transcriptional regulator [Verrucomicrobia bacterium]|nr:helix-turn-helix transcriptional regulator [Verrucomicrobiota bacterium]